MTVRPSTVGAWARLLATLLVIAACGGYAITHLRVGTELTHFVSSPDEAVRSSIVARMAKSEGARTEVFVIDAPQAEVALDAAAELAEHLREHPGVAWVRTGVDEGLGEAFYELVYPHRFHHAAEEPQNELPPQLSDEGLQKMALQLRRRLASPSGVWIKRIAPGDPWLFFETRTRALERMREGALEVADGRFMTSDGRGAVLLLGTKHSPFDTDAQAALETAVGEGIESVTRERPQASVARSSIGRLAVRSEATIRQDVQRISVASSIAVLLVFLALYGSIRVWLAAALPLLAGLSVAAAVIAALYTSVHGITLAFGATLIGVAVDYPVHFFTHQAMGAGRSGRATIAAILPGLRMGAATTAVAFAALAAVELPGIQELGVFAAVGIATALTVTAVVLPDLPIRPRTTALLRLVEGRVATVRDRMRQHPRWLALPVAAVALVCVVGLPRVAWVDDVAALNRLEPTALAEDEEVRARVSRHDLGRLVVATGDSLEQALQRNDEVAQRLRRASEQGLVRFTSLHDLVYSPDLQQRNARVFADAPDLPQRMRAALQAEGFVPEAFAPTAKTLRDPGPPLTLAEVLDSDLADLARPFVLSGDGPPAIVTFVRDLEGPDVLAPYLDDLPGVYDFDRVRFSAHVYRRYRQRVTWVVAAGLGVVCVLLLAHYRSPRRVAAGLGPALLSVAATAAVLGLLGEELHILHVMGLLLVLGIGADYGIFLVEQARREHDLRPTLVSVVAAWSTTVCAFGLLALSDHPALRALGTTVALGVTISMLLAPLAALALTPTQPRTHPPAHR